MANSIYAHVTLIEKERFFAYCREIGFKVSEISRFLILRELRLGNLKNTGKKYEIRRARTDDKVTVHLPDKTIKSYFVEHSKKLGISSSEAFSLLIREELSERRFEVALHS